ncbi:hypothetical protein FACS1894103_4040 [Campylobacterota bacterium]|nr:hypothetical protein FACS1894103_4040 [Campylobacterota bacterium]
MAEQALKIKISVDGKTGELKIAKNELTGASNKTSEAITRLSDRIKCCDRSNVFHARQ